MAIIHDKSMAIFHNKFDTSFHRSLLKRYEMRYQIIKL
jgi:hypothetical protein